MTAAGLIEIADRRAGAGTMLITAAAGGVGSPLVQLARRAGWRVIACVGSAKKQAAVAELEPATTVSSGTESTP